MTEFTAYQGLDAKGIWVDGRVGFGHIMLCTTPGSLGERQPCSLDGKVWITADARVDGRADLIRELESRGLGGSEGATDVELILHAYHVWGEDCVRHLIGDFAFAIWDGRRRCLFCARDHFGVKPFYYSQTANSILFASDIDSLRKHSGVSNTLNELAVGDFLLFGGNQDENTTIYRDIRRVPPAHRLTIERHTMRLDRYWKIPTDGHTRYGDDADYVVRYSELFHTAVKDRLRADRVAVLMSGGTDSTAVAAVASRCLQQNNLFKGVRACTVVYNDLLPGDQEGYYAGLTANALGIPIDYLNGGEYQFYGRWDQPEMRCKQPVDHSTLALWFDCYFLCAKHSPVILTGYGGDLVMGGSCSYYVNLLKRRRISQFMIEVGRHIGRNRSLRGLGFRSALKRLVGRSAWQPDFPAWISPEFEARIGLRERYKYCTREVAPEHDNHPDAYAALIAPLWTDIFESDPPGSVPLEVRHPFFDVRLITFLLAIPQVPWCRSKMIHREAMRGILPEPVLNRPKAPLAGNRVLARLNHSTAPDTIDTSLAVVGENYVDRVAYRSALEQFKRGDSHNYAPITAPISLECWIQTSTGISSGYEPCINYGKHS